MTRQERYTTATAEETEALGEQLADRLEPGDLVCLEGDLAAGKTTLVRGLVRGLGGDADEVSSPTFVIVQSYPCHHEQIRVIHHVDLYRLEDSRGALREIGLEELLSEPDAVIAVEWPRPSITDWLPPGVNRWRVILELGEQPDREITISREQ